MCLWIFKSDLRSSSIRYGMLFPVDANTFFFVAGLPIISNEYWTIFPGTESELVMAMSAKVRVATEPDILAIEE